MEPDFIPFEHLEAVSDGEMSARAQAFRDQLRRRRTIRDYASTDVSQDVIDACLEAAGTAPSGANRQPWHFVVIRDSAVKTSIRKAAEEEERIFYNERAPQEWLDALRPLGTDETKEFLEIAPVLIAIFAKSHELTEDGKKLKNYYVQESVGIATGMLIAALHIAGLSMLTHTPSPMGFLNKILKRPSNERASILLVVGHAADDARVPAISKKQLNDIRTII